MVELKKKELPPNTIVLYIPSVHKTMVEFALWTLHKHTGKSLTR